MSFLTNAKDLAEAKEKIAALESQFAQSAASVAELTEACSVSNKTLDLVKGELASANLALKASAESLAKAVADLAAEQAAHAATKAGVDGLASAKAQQILAGAGHRPVAVDASAANGGAGDIIAAIQGAADPFTRTKLFRQNREQLRKQRN